MEKTLQEQYNLIKEGKGNKAYFLKSAYRLFPDMISQVNSFDDTTRILKNRGIISEGIGGLVTTGKKQDWHSIFKENMDNLQKDEEADFDKVFDEYVKNSNPDEEDEELARLGDEYAQGMEDIHALPNKGNLREAKEEKIKEPSKEVLDNQKHNFDYKDTKNYDNLFGQEFLKGYYTEMKDPKNTDKDVEELRAIVAKNLAKDINYYVKDGQFGVKGLGYTTEAPGLGEPKEPKGKFKSSGYGDLKESVLRLVIYNTIKEALDFSEYSNDALADMIINLSRFEGNEEEIQIAKAELEKRKNQKSLSETLDMVHIKNEGEEAKKKAMDRRITNEIVRRKKQIKALETLTELEGGEDNMKKVKELQSEIKKLEGAKNKLHGKKEVKEAGLYKLKNPNDAKTGLPTVVDPDDQTEKSSEFNQKYKK
jgi:ribosomal protein S7